MEKAGQCGWATAASGVSRHGQPCSFIIPTSASMAHRWGLGATKLQGLPIVPGETFCSEARNPRTPSVQHPSPGQSLPRQAPQPTLSEEEGLVGRDGTASSFASQRQSQPCPNLIAFSFCLSILDRTGRGIYDEGCANGKQTRQWEQDMQYSWTSFYS